MTITPETTKNATDEQPILSSRTRSITLPLPARRLGTALEDAPPAGAGDVFWASAAHVPPPSTAAMAASEVTGDPTPHGPRTLLRPRSRLLRRFGLAFATIFVLSLPTAEAALVRVPLGIYGGRAVDSAAWIGGGGATRIMVSVSGDAAGFRLEDGGAFWEPIFYGRPGEIDEIEADVTAPATGSGAGVLFATLNDGRLIVNASETGGGVWSIAGWTTVGNPFSSGSTLLEEAVSLTGAASGMYVGTRAGNVYRSTDGGTTWSLLVTPSAGDAVESIAVYSDDATNPTLYITAGRTGARLLYTAAFAGSYAATTVPVSGSPTIERVFVHPSTVIAEAPLLFVTGDSPSQSVYRGETGGTAWSTVTVARHYFQHMAFDAVNERIYAASAVSTDRGASFTQLPNYSRTAGDLHANDATVAIDPNDANRIYVADDWFLGEWQNSAGTWAANGPIANNDGVAAIEIDDMAQVADTAATKDTFLIAGKSGIGITTDFVTHAGPTPTWTDYPIFPGHDGSVLAAVHVQDHDGDGTVMETMLAGNQAGRVYRTTTGSTVASDWSQVFEVQTDLAATWWQDGNRTAINDIVENPSSMDDLWLAFGDWDSGRVGGGIACSTDNGATWAIDPGWSAGGDSMSVNALQITATRFWAGVGKSDDSDPAHAGLYTMTGSLAGCGSTSWSQHSTGTALDSAVVNDLDGYTTSPVYAASSAGLFRGELAGAWSWSQLDGTLAGLPTGEYRALAVNPSPSPYDEELYAAIGSSVYRLRNAAGIWTITLVTPPVFDQVYSLLWDDLVVGSTSGLYSVGLPTAEQKKCRKAVRKVRTRYLKTALGATVACLDASLSSGATCPDATTQAVIAAAALAFGQIDTFCDDVTVEALRIEWPAGCWNVRTAGALEICLEADAEATVESLALTEYGNGGTERASASTCQRTIGRAWGRGYATGALAALDKCITNLDAGRTDDCPDATTSNKISQLAVKATDKVLAACSDGEVATLAGAGFGGVCDTVTTGPDLNACLLDAHDDALGDLLAAPADLGLD